MRTTVLLQVLALQCSPIVIMNLTSQCQYNAKSEKTVLDDNVKMEDR